MREPEISVSSNAIKIMIQQPEDLIHACNFILSVLDENSPIETYKENLTLAINCTYELADALSDRFASRIAVAGTMESKKALEKRKKDISKLKTKLTFMLKAIDYQKTKEAVLKFKYNVTLGFEGLGLLNGFGVSNKWGDKIDYFDPERKSIMGGL